MHQIHSVRALILGSLPASEGDARLCLLSEELGVVWARAKSVREERSKLRYALMPYGSTTVSLVRGKYGWRITGAVDVHAITSHEGRAAFARLSRLVQRLTLPDKDAHRVYAPLASAHYALSSCVQTDEIELVTALRVLAALGYVAPRGEYAHVLTDTSCDESVLALVGGRRVLVLQDINKALTESHL